LAQLNYAMTRRASEYGMPVGSSESKHNSPSDLVVRQRANEQTQGSGASLRFPAQTWSAH